MINGQNSTRIIRVEISINEPVGSSTVFAVDETHEMRICTLEDIVAEKLRALLQQPIRNRGRRQDLLDIAVIMKEGHILDRDKVADFLLTKAAARDVPASRAAFRDPGVASRARAGYDELESTTRVRFVPFKEAWAELQNLIDALPIPLGDEDAS